MKPAAWKTISVILPGDAQVDAQITFDNADRLIQKSAATAEKPRVISAWLAVTAFCCLALISAANAQQNNTIGTVAGPGPAFTGVALQTFLPNPTGIAEDSAGNLYIAAQYSYYIYKVTPSTGAMTIVAGTGIAGPSPKVGDSVPATAATFTSVVTVAVDASGNVYIFDASRLRVVNTQSSAISVLGTSINPGYIGTVSGSSPCSNAGTVYPSCGDTGPASEAQFYNPQGMYFDGSGNLFIADTVDQEIRFINLGSSAVSLLGTTVQAGNVATVAGNGWECNTPGTPCGDGGSATAPGKTGAKLDTPIGVVTDKAGNLYIGDSRDQRIRCVANAADGCPSQQTVNGKNVYPTSVGEIDTYAGKGAPFCTDPVGNSCDNKLKMDATFHNPSGIWLDPAGNLYVADQWDNKIREVTPGLNGKVGTVCGTGRAGYEDGKCPGDVEFYGPTAIVIDAAGNAFVADSGNDYIREGNEKTFSVKTIAGNGWVNPGPNGVAATQATLANPVDVKWDNAGANYYISDNGNNVIWEVNATTQVATIVAGNGHPSQFCTEPPPATCNGDNGPPTSATLDGPNGIALDLQGNLYITDSSDSAVRAVNMQSSQNLVVGTVSIPPGEILTIAGQQGVECLGPSQCGDGGLATQANVDYPIAVSVDSNRNVYISDYFIGRVRCVVTSSEGCPNSDRQDEQIGWIVSSAGQRGGSGQGKNGVPGDDSKLNHPYGVGTLNDNLIFDDSSNNMVRCVANVANGCGANTLEDYIYEWALTGAQGLSGDGGPATQAVESVPQGLDFDPAGNLYIGGGADLIVRRIDGFSGTILTVAGKPVHPGQGFGGDGGPSTSATLDNIGMSVNGNEELVIADAGNNRVRQVDMVPELAQHAPVNINFGSVQVGQSSPQQPATIQNYGLATLELGTTQLSDMTNFSTPSNTCNNPQNQLPPGPVTGPLQSTCTVEVVFNPQSPGTFNATLKINTALKTVTFNLSGTGTQ